MSDPISEALQTLEMAIDGAPEIGRVRETTRSEAAGGMALPAVSIRCSCGSAYAPRDWWRLRFVGVQDSCVLGDGLLAELELRDCPCRSTIGAWVSGGSVVTDQAAVELVADDKAYRRAGSHR